MRAEGTWRGAQCGTFARKHSVNFRRCMATLLGATPNPAWRPKLPKGPSFGDVVDGGGSRVQRGGHQTIFQR